MIEMNSESSGSSRMISFSDRTIESPMIEASGVRSS